MACKFATTEILVLPNVSAAIKREMQPGGKQAVRKVIPLCECLSSSSRRADRPGFRQGDKGLLFISVTRPKGVRLP